jgi:hypothetical protein
MPVNWSALGKTANYTNVVLGLGGWQSAVFDGSTNERLSTGNGPYGQNFNLAVADARRLAQAEGIICKAEPKETRSREKRLRRSRT